MLKDDKSQSHETSNQSQADKNPFKDSQEEKIVRPSLGGFESEKMTKDDARTERQDSIGSINAISKAQHLDQTTAMKDAGRESIK